MPGPVRPFDTTQRVFDDDAACRRHLEAFDREQEDLRIRLALGDILVPGDGIEVAGDGADIEDDVDVVDRRGGSDGLPPAVLAHPRQPGAHIGQHRHALRGDVVTVALLLGAADARHLVIGQVVTEVAAQHAAVAPAEVARELLPGQRSSFLKQDLLPAQPV